MEAHLLGKVKDTEEQFDKFQIEQYDERQVEQFDGFQVEHFVGYSMNGKSGISMNVKSIKTKSIIEGNKSNSPSKSTSKS